jgi:hypothetical protein
MRVKEPSLAWRQGRISRTRIVMIVAIVGFPVALLRCAVAVNGLLAPAADQDGGASGATIADDGAETGPDATLSPKDSADSGVDSGYVPSAESAADTAVTQQPSDAGVALACVEHGCAPAEFCATRDGEPGGAQAGARWPQCEEAVFGNVCDNPTATLVFDPYSADNAAGVTLGAALGSACHMTIESPDAAPFEPDSGQPTTGIADLCVIGGGAFGQPAVAYLDSRGLTDVYLSSANDDAGAFDIIFTDRGGSGPPRVIAAAPFSSTPTNTDYFLVELVVDPASGSLCLVVLGMGAQGTSAGAYYVANMFFATGAYKASTKSWYVYYWVASSDTGVPGSSDTFTLVASGP